MPSADPGTPARARQDAKTFRLVDEFDAIIRAAAKHDFAFPQDRRVPEIMDSLKTALLRSADVPTDRLEGSCLVGDKMTHADILGAWAAMMRDRPAFKAAQEKVAESRRLSIFHRVALRKSGSMAIGGGLGWQGLRINA